MLILYQIIPALKWEVDAAVCDRIQYAFNGRGYPDIAQIHGNKAGLKRSELETLERLYRKRVTPRSVIQPELARQICAISEQINRQVGILVTRGGGITHVIVGDTRGIFLPSLDESHPLGKRALRGLRLVHTHLTHEPINRDDLTDLSLLRLDLVAALDVHDEQMNSVHVAHLLPGGGKSTQQLTIDLFRTDFDFIETVESLDREISRRLLVERGADRERAILISVSTGSRADQEDSMDELRELAESSDLAVLDTVIQRPKQINPKSLLGEGRLKDLIISAMDSGATLLVFDQDLSPSQIRNIGEMTELKVIDRSQLILDIFARRAHSRDGKVQVELAQLKYRLPRLAGKGTAMSRLMGGIGGRGPGEKKLEVDRRRVRDRVSLLEKELKSLGQARAQRKSRRVERGVPIVSIIGYTNAGKSTLLNALTKSKTHVEQRMFATLDTASRRLRFPRERELIITDTVGFIRDLPSDLMAAFRATLEELGDADLLLHVLDASNPRLEQQIESVEKVLDDLGLMKKPRIMALNKSDLVSAEECANLATRLGAIPISALEPSSFGPLLEAVEGAVWNEKLADTQV